MFAVSAVDLIEIFMPKKLFFNVDYEVVTLGNVLKFEIRGETLKYREAKMTS